jgi:hypothetical protein
MGILLAFAPFFAFAVIDRLANGTAGLIVGTAVSAALILRDLLTPNRAPKVLEIGTVIQFGGLALYAVLFYPTWSIVGVRLRVDAGLLLIVLVSIALQRPFTLRYAREQVAREFWSSPTFVRTNYVITAVWALAFGGDAADQLGQSQGIAGAGDAFDCHQRVPSATWVCSMSA